MTEDFEKYKFPNPRHDEDSYVKMVAGLLPDGVIWGIGELISSLSWQDTTTSGNEYQDTTTATDEYQDSTATGYDGSVLGRILSVFGAEFARLEVDAWGILNQTDPGVADGNVLDDWERNLALPSPCVTVTQTLEERQRAAHSKLFDEYVTTSESAFINKAASLGFEITINENPEIYQPFIVGVARCGWQRLGDRGGYSVLEITIVSGTGDQDVFECEMNRFKPAHCIIVYV